MQISINDTTKIVTFTKNNKTYNYSWELITYSHNQDYIFVKDRNGNILLTFQYSSVSNISSNNITELTALLNAEYSYKYDLTSSKIKSDGTKIYLYDNNVWSEYTSSGGFDCNNLPTCIVDINTKLSALEDIIKPVTSPTAPFTLGKSIELKETNSKRNYLSSFHRSSFTDLQGLIGGFISGWIKVEPPASGKRSTIFCNRGINETSNGLHFRILNTRIYDLQLRQDGVNLYFATTSQSGNSSTFQHFGINIDPVNSTLQIWIDGSLANSATLNVGAFAILGNANSWFIGADGSETLDDQHNLMLDGEVASVAIWNQGSLTSTQIGDIYSAGLNGLLTNISGVPSPTHWWPGNGIYDSHTHISDRSGSSLRNDLVGHGTTLKNI